MESGSGTTDNQIRYLESGMDLHSGTCLDIIGRIFEGQERVNAIQQLREGLGHYVRQDKSYREAANVLHALEAKVQEKVDAEMFDGVDLEKEFNELKKQMCKGIDEVEVAKHAKTKKFEASAKQILTGVSASQSVEDEELITTKVSITTLDPITKTQIKDPVKNRRCGHVYDKDTMMELVSKNPRMRCPYSGCANKAFVTEDDLEQDREVKRHLQKMERMAKK